ncbi:MAG: hypothetical protein IT228_09820 [Flavobacteriales bacterium]|nr:hypothetical protein [Flavobacteriales bacterium]MCC6577624.1 hypothetical protein [Flavobacteriales bacterium]NUQ14272.1 hypothetical protein [Flavobacteriales bacterium]
MLNALFHVLERFEAWFDRRFGWFFTNGMKDRARREAALTSARTRSSPR